MRLVHVVLVLALSNPAFSQNARTAAGSAEQELAQLCRASLQHYAAHDAEEVAFIRAHFLSPFVELRTNGRLEIIGVEQSIREDREYKQKNPEARMSIEPSEITPYIWGDTAVVTAKFVLHISGSNNPKLSAWNGASGTLMQTWSRTNGQWKIGAMSLTPTSDRKQAAGQ